MKLSYRWWMLPLWIVSAHACVVVVAVVMSLAAIGSAQFCSGSKLAVIADSLTTASCLPLQTFLDNGRLDIFFILLPLNSLVYGLVLWGVLRLVMLLCRRRSAR